MIPVPSAWQQNQQRTSRETDIKVGIKQLLRKLEQVNPENTGSSIRRQQTQIIAELQWFVTRYGITSRSELDCLHKKQHGRLQQFLTNAGLNKHNFVDPDGSSLELKKFSNGI